MAAMDAEFEADAQADEAENEQVGVVDEGDSELQRNLAEASSVYSCKHCQFVTKQSGAMRHHVMAHFGKNHTFSLHYTLKADRPHPRDNSTHRQSPWTDNDSSLLFAALSEAEPLISTAARQKFDLDP